MNTSSNIVVSKDISKHNHAKEHRIVISARLPVKERKYEAIRIRIHRNFIETIKSSVVVFACLTLYKITGVHAWWIQFVQKILNTQ